MMFKARTTINQTIRSNGSSVLLLATLTTLQSQMI